VREFVSRSYLASIYREAAELIDAGTYDFACNAINCAVFGKHGMKWHLESEATAKYKALMDPGEFRGELEASAGFSHGRHIRVIALLLAAEASA
jgi:hypothetical protein